MSKLLLCSFKHTFMRRAHFFTVLCVLLILKVLCGVVALCFVLNSLRFSIAWFRSVYGCSMFFLYHTRSFVQTGWCFFPSFGYVSIGGVTTDYIVSFSVLFYSEAAINHTYTQFFHNEKKISLAIQWPEMSFSNSVSIFSLAFSLFILSLFYLCLCFWFQHTHTHTQPDGRCEFHVSCIFFKRSKHKYANNSNAFHMWSVCCFYWVCNLYESYSNGRKNL